MDDLTYNALYNALFTVNAYRVAIHALASMYKEN
jgi:hypothetical protein